MLTLNHCQEAFWLGNLKNRDLKVKQVDIQSLPPWPGVCPVMWLWVLFVLQGEEILSQRSTQASEEEDDEEEAEEQQQEQSGDEVPIFVPPPSIACLHAS